MSKFKSKLARRVMAILLSGAMVMSNMSVYAAELSTETTTEVVEEVATEVESEAEETADTLGSGDEGTGDEQSSSGDEGTGDEQSSSGDEGTGDEQSSSGDEGTGDEQSSSSDEGTGDEQSSSGDEGTGDEQSSSSEESSGDESSSSDEGGTGTTDESSEKSITFDPTAFSTASSPITTSDLTDEQKEVMSITGTVTTKKAASSSATPVDSVEIKAGGASSINIKIPENATEASLEVSVFSTGSAKTTPYALLNGDNIIKADGAETEGYSTASGGLSAATKVTYSSLVAGTNYSLQTSTDSANGLRISSMTISYTLGGDDTPTDRGKWSNVDAPEIAKTTYDVSAKDTGISVKVKGVIDKAGEGADKLTVYMYDTKDVTDETEPVDTRTSTAKTTADEADGNHYTTLTFNPTASGDYFFKAVLERSVDTDTDYADKESALSDAVAFKLPLNTPVISKAEFKETASDGTGTITVSWGAVTEADYYVIAMTYSDDANSATEIESVTYVPTADESDAASFSKDITGLAAGSTVKVTVQAVRGTAEGDEVAEIDKSEVSSVRTVTLEIVEIAEGTHVFEAKNLSSWTATGPTYVDLTDDGYFKFMPKDTANLIFTEVGGAEFEFDDGYITSQLLKFGGKYEANKYKWIEFTTSGSAEIKVWWNDASGGRSVALFSKSSPATEIKVGTTGVKSESYIDTFGVTEAGTYIIAPSTSVGNGDVRIAKIEVTEGAKVNAEYTFDGASVYTAGISAGTYNDGDAVSYVGDYFTVLYSAKAKVEAKSYPDAWSDGYGGGYRLSFGDVASTEKNAIKFTTTEDEATVRIWWKAGADGRHVQLLDASGNQVAVSSDEEGEGAASKKDTSYITKFKLTSAGTYYLGNESGNNYLFKVKVTEGHEEDPVDWSTVDAPVIKSAEQKADSDGVLTGDITVTVAAYIDEIKGCEKVTVEMYGEDPSANENAEALATASSSKTTTSAEGTVSVTFTPTASGNYYFIARASRAEERTTKDSAVYAMANKFILPLTAPSITRATNDGKGGIEIAYNSVAEADKYIATATQVTKNDDGTYTPVEGAEAVTTESVVTEDNTATTATLTGLTIGSYYAFRVHAVRGEEEGSESEAFYKIVKNTPEQVWDYSAYGVSTSTAEADVTVYDATSDSKSKTVKMAKNGYSGDVNDGEITVWSLGGAGKIVPASSEDGLSFLYTKIDKDTNFKLTATAVVDSWTYSNGQEGFGLMVSDSVGEHGNGATFWNNSYMAVATKMEYYWNGSTILPTSVGVGDDRVRYNMYLGIGSIVRTGVTDEWKTEQEAGATMPSKFTSQSLSLEHTAGTKGLETGSYNIIGSATKSGGTDIAPLLTEVKLTIEKNNTGYFISYEDANGEVITNKYYEDRTIVDKDYANQSLLQIDKDYMYVGFFAARNAMVTFKDIDFTTSSVDVGGEPEEKPSTYNTPNYKILSANITNSASYDIEFTSNWRGTLSVTDSTGRELLNETYFTYLENTETTVLGALGYENTTLLDKYFEYETDEEGKRISGTEELKADVKAIIPINDNINSDSKLSVGSNKFTVTFTPDKSWHIDDDELQLLSSYDTSVQTLTVNYRAYGEEGTNIYVAPNGKSTADGTKDSPLDIYTAVKYVQAGQTIVLLKGTYSLKTALSIERGIDGTADKPIRMIAEPGSYDRTNPFNPSGVVIDFNGIASGMTLAGDYWYLRGFDVTGSSDGNKGLQVSGSHNTLDQINTYYNGNTGIQICRYKSTDLDKSDDWPSYNTILNCTSYLNSDSGYEDADGFAAKLTIGDGNVFDGCIAAYNADDGWDLYAKAESGPIGQVIIKNCVALRNGYLLENVSGKLDLNGTTLIDAGNGNGFKMGGESISGYHMLLNSYSFENKANGIESNSCPDIQVYNSVSFNNEAYNIAFYTKTATQTDFRAGNIISFRTTNTDVKDELKPTGTVGESKTDNWIYNDYTDSSNFYWNESKGVSENADGKAVTEAWFKSLTFGGMSSITRNANGTVNMGDFLALSDKADTSTFVKLEQSTNLSGAIVYKAVEGDAEAPGLGGTESENGDKAAVDTSGSIDSNDDEDISSSDTWTDDELNQLDLSDKTLKILLNFGYDSDAKQYYDSEGRYYTDYTGTAIKPTVRVAYGTTELSAKNYSVSYKNNTKAYELNPGDAGFDEKLAPTVVIKGKGNYAGEYKLYFTIKKIAMTSDKVTSADIATVATGKSQKINPAVTFNGKKLGTKEYAINRVYTLETVTAEDGTETTAEKTYTGSYESAGTYYIELKGADLNFTGTKVVTVRVLSEEDAANKTPMSKVKVAKIPDQIYDGTAHEPDITVTGLASPEKDENGHYVAGTGDYDVAYYNNTDIGIASVVLTGNIEKGYYGTKTVTFKTIAKPFNIKDYSVKVKGIIDGKEYSAETDEQYKNLTIPSTGSAITFGSVVVKVIGSDVTLTEGIDYTVSYKGNAKAGKASIVVKGMGNYKGSLTRTFTITPLEINDSNTKVAVIDKVVYTKGGAKPSVVVKVNGKTISSSYYTVNYKNNNKLGTAYVSITGKKLLKGTVKEAASFEVVAKDLSTVTMSADNVYYGTAKEKDGDIAYATKLVVKDGTKTLSLNSDYTVTYYESDEFNETLFKKYGKAYKYKQIETENADGTSTTSTEEVPGTALEKNSKITYTGANKTIYAVITAGKNGLYTGTTYTSYKVVGKNDVKYAKIAKITDIYSYNDGTVSAPKLNVTIQNRSLNESGKYVKNSEYTTLKLNEDYEIIDIKNNNRFGTATITIQGIGYYAGTNKVTFKIAKKDLSVWDYYVANAITKNIIVEVNESDVSEGGAFVKGITFENETIKQTDTDEKGNEVTKDVTVESVLAKAAKGKIYTIGTKTSSELTYGTHFTATYSNNVVDVSKLTFDEDGYAEQTATTTITGIEPYTGSKTITFTIRVKKTVE